MITPADPAPAGPAPAPAPPAAPQAKPPAPADPKPEPGHYAAIREQARAQGAEQAAQDFAKALGMPLDQAKDALGRLAELENAGKSEVERLTTQVTDLSTKAQRGADLEAAVKLHADQAIAALSDADRAFVQALGLDSPVAQLNAITALQQRNAAQAPAAAQQAPEGHTSSAAAPPPPPQAPAEDTPDALYDKWQGFIEKGQNLTARAFYAHHANKISQSSKYTRA